MALSLLEKLFGKSDRSGSVAKDRLKLVLAHDRADIPGPVMDALRQDLLAVISKYVEIDESALDVELDRSGNGSIIVANIPIRRIRGRD
jgi:cell division topological specificity factor